MKIPAIEVIVGLHELLERFAERLCDCNGPGNRKPDPDTHAEHCEYRRTIDG